MKKVESEKPRIVNIVATGHFPTEKLDLIKLYLELDLDDKEYEPETYPALLGKTRSLRGHITLYQNGKYILTGIKSEEELNKIYEEVYRKLRDVGAF